MAAINVRSEKHHSASYTGDVRIGGDLVVEGTLNSGSNTFVNLFVTGTLTAANATITSLTATSGTIGTLNSTTGTITTLTSTTATITNLTVSNNLTLGGVAANSWVWVPSTGTTSGRGVGGTGNVAAALNSLAYGLNCTVNASAPRSFAFGQNCACNASASVNGEQFAGGFFSSCSGRGSFVFGRSCVANSISSYAFGQQCTIGTNSDHSLAVGDMCTVGNSSGQCCSLGQRSNVVHSNSFVWGCGFNSNLSTGGLGSGNTNTLSQANNSFNIGATGGAFFGLAGANFAIDGVVVHTCDESLKEEISDFTTLALNAINNIPIKRYKRKLDQNSNSSDWVTDWHKYEVGFLLSDLPAVLKTGPNNQYVNTLSCIAATFKALQEARAFLLTLRQDVDSIIDTLSG